MKRKADWKFCPVCGQEQCDCTSEQVAQIWYGNAKATCRGAVAPKDYTPFVCTERFPESLRDGIGYCPRCGRQQGFTKQFRIGDWITDDTKLISGVVIARDYQGVIPIYRIACGDPREGGQYVESIITDLFAVLVRSIEDCIRDEMKKLGWTPIEIEAWIARVAEESNE